jgi:hypothetical protein
MTIEAALSVERIHSFVTPTAGQNRQQKEKSYSFKNQHATVDVTQGGRPSKSASIPAGAALPS